jgi:putative drug exporter of the RND superfamily
VQKIARSAIANPRRIIFVAALIVAAAAVFGIPVIKSLSSGGFQDSSSQSWRASQLLADKFGVGDMQLVLAVTAEEGTDSTVARNAAAELLALLKGQPFMTDIKSAWTAPPEAARLLVSKDGKTGLIVAGITGGETGAQRHATDLLDRLPHFNGVTVKAGGEATKRKKTC